MGTYRIQSALDVFLAKEEIGELLNVVSITVILCAWQFK
jgi:hypothetical protein